MTRFLILLIAVNLAANSQCFAKQRIDFTEYDLQNGLHVILHRNSSSPNVAIGMMYHVGSKNEKPERTGFAHFFEHLYFHGSKNIPQGEFDKIVNEAGGYDNASTNYDRTYYYNLLPSNQLALGLWLEAERMRHPRITQEGIDKEREVVKEEKRQRFYASELGSVEMDLMERTYPNHPYRWHPIGSMDHLNAANMNDFKAFHEMFYVPENACLTISGDIDIDSTKQIINYYFSDIPNTHVPIFRPKFNTNISFKPVCDTIYKDIERPHIGLAYNTVPISHKDAYVLEFISVVLNSDEYSIFKKHLINAKQKKASRAETISYAREDAGIFQIRISAADSVDAETLVQALEEQLELLKTEKVEEWTYEMYRNQFKVGLQSIYATNSLIAEYLAENYFLKNGNSKAFTEYIQQITSTTRDDIQRVANAYFNNSNRVLIYYLPKTVLN